MEFQWQLSFTPDTDRLDKKEGVWQGELAEGQEKVAWARSPQRFFRPLLGVQPVGLSPHRRPQGIQMRESGPAGGKQTEGQKKS